MWHVWVLCVHADSSTTFPVIAPLYMRTGLIKYLQEAVKYLGSCNWLGQQQCMLQYGQSPLSKGSLWFLNTLFLMPALPPANTLLIPEGQGRLFPHFHCYPHCPWLCLLCFPGRTVYHLFFHHRSCLVLQLWACLPRSMYFLRAVTIVFILFVSPIVPRHNLELSNHTIHFNSVDYSTGT